MAYTTIDNPTDYFTTVLSTSTGSALTIDTGFKPDWLWTKARNQARSHELHDTTRGDNKRLKSDATTAEESYSNYLAFTSTGATFGTNHNLGYHDGGTTTGVSWAWKANGGTTTTLSGGISATVQANTTAGFSIVKFTASGNNNQVEHGLGAVPHFIIAKGKDVSDNWFVYHKSIGPNGYIMLNKTDATDSPNSTVWRNIDPTNQYFYVSSGGFNDDSTDVIAYCFAEKQGYSKFGSYTGNGNADGAFVYTGFKPVWIMVKKTNEAEAWFIADSKRTPTNTNDDILEANDSAAEGNSTTLDLLSNGFKFRHENGNTTGDSYIYMAFAESPFVSSEGVPTTAR